MKRPAIGVMCALVVLCTSALGVQWPTWTWSRTHDSVFYNNNDLQLTVNNGSHAVAMGDYGNGYWLSVPVRRVSGSDVEIIAYEWDNGNHAAHWPVEEQFWWSYRPWNACVAANNKHKLWLSVESLRTDNGRLVDKAHTKSSDLTRWGPDNDWLLSHLGHGCNDGSITGVCFGDTSPCWCVVTGDNYKDDNKELWRLQAAVTTDSGEQWDRYIDITQDTVPSARPMGPSLAVNSDNGTDVYLVYDTPDSSCIFFRKSTNHGYAWGSEVMLSPNGGHPCIAAVGTHIFACWQDGSKMVYRISPDSGARWYPDNSNPAAVISTSDCSFANASAVADGDKRGVLLVYEKTGSSSYEMFDFGLFVDGANPHIAWSGGACFMPYALDSLRPSVTTMYYDNWYKPIGATVCNIPGSGGRGIDLRMGEWDYVDF